MSVRLECSVLPANATQLVKRERVRASSVYVTMWGGDTLHALNLPRGGAAVEMRHSTFARGAPWSWVSMARLWTMRYVGPRALRPLSFYALNLPASVTVPSRALHVCHINSSAQTAKFSNVDERWRCYWNADVTISFRTQLLPVLERVVFDRSTGAVNLGLEDVCRKRYWGGRVVRDLNGTVRAAGCPT